MTGAGPGANGDVMLAPDAVRAAAQRTLDELLALRETVDRLYHEPPPGSADYGNLNADLTVATASARFSVDAGTQGRALIDQVVDAARKVVGFAEAMRNNDQANAARLAEIARESRGG
jgi:hypothetical protein